MLKNIQTIKIYIFFFIQKKLFPLFFLRKGAAFFVKSLFFRILKNKIKIVIKILL